MADDDHYVAQTYLKHFAGANGQLRAYRKSDGTTFPCRPRDICHEPDGDIIPDFLSVPDYLGQYRGAFEQEWNDAIEGFKKRSPDIRDKFHVAGYWAQLLVCTPTWRRVHVAMSDRHVVGTLRASHALRAEAGKADPKLADAIAALERGEIEVATEPDYIRAQNALKVVKLAWGLYNSHWKVFESNYEIEFVTSDNPAAFQDQGDRPPSGNVPFIRFLPITPKMAIMCDLTEHGHRFMNSEPNFEQPPAEWISGGLAELRTVKKINECVVKCAEDLVLCSGESDYVKDLTERFARFSVENESMTIRTGRGFLLGSRTRATERKTEAAA